ncbi:MAG: 4-(cytidine 5'-diphospho)-2-C-methyl-D-erythritol kinase [Desulfovibrionaceae bacterium]
MAFTPTITILQSNCKINLALSVGRLLPNGYHELDTILYPLPYPQDNITVETMQKKGFFMTTSTDEVVSTNNTILTAYTLVKKHLKTEKYFPSGYSIHLEKHVPIQAGLGGGSANAARFLLFLQEEVGIKQLSDETLYEIAQNIGDDVPFFIKNTPALKTKNSPNLLPFPYLLEGIHVLLVLFFSRISTKWAFNTYDTLLQKKSLKDLTSHKSYSKTVSMVPVYRNCFEEIVFDEYPDIRVCKERLLQSGSFFVMLSGSGSSLFALYRDKSSMIKAERNIQNLCEFVYMYSL